MHRLPDDFDPKFLVGHELGQICFTTNTVSIAFEGEIMITVGSTFVYKGPADDPGCREAVPAKTGHLLLLLGRTVKMATKAEGRHLVLAFDDGQELTILDDSDVYESYTIS